MNRRAFLGASAAGVCSTAGAATPIPIIDCHIHLFDTGRPQGVPWPDKANATLYRPALPERYRSLAAPLGVVGAIEVEASPWLEDNQWVLDVAATDTMLVGTVGNLEPGRPEFASQLERFHRNPLFRGIRYGSLWGRHPEVEFRRPEFVADVKRLSQAGLTLDTATATPALLEDILRLTDSVPDLRVVIDHLPQMSAPADAQLREIGKRPQIYVKLSEIFRRVDGRIPTDLAFYRPRLDQLFGVFGEDRVLFGSDWPNSDNWKPYGDTLRIAQEYLATKSQAAREKYFWRNSVQAYRWVRRHASQPNG